MDKRVKEPEDGRSGQASERCVDVPIRSESGLDVLPLWGKTQLHGTNPDHFASELVLFVAMSARTGSRGHAQYQCCASDEFATSFLPRCEAAHRLRHGDRALCFVRARVLRFTCPHVLGTTAQGASRVAGQVCIHLSGWVLLDVCATAALSRDEPKSVHGKLQDPRQLLGPCHVDNGMTVSSGGHPHPQGPRRRHPVAATSNRW
jgi:hypothetical protein